MHYFLVKCRLTLLIDDGEELKFDDPRRKTNEFVLSMRPSTDSPQTSRTSPSKGVNVTFWHMMKFLNRTGIFKEAKLGIGNSTELQAIYHEGIYGDPFLIWTFCLAETIEGKRFKYRIDIDHIDDRAAVIQELKIYANKGLIEEVNDRSYRLSRGI